MKRTRNDKLALPILLITVLPSLLLLPGSGLLTTNASRCGWSLFRPILASPFRLLACMSHIFQYSLTLSLPLFLFHLQNVGAATSLVVCMYVSRCSSAFLYASRALLPHTRRSKVCIVASPFTTPEEHPRD